MTDKILLFPYWLVLKLRHLMYDCGLLKVHSTQVPSICIGNITVGGTGKTPHTEMLLRTLLEDADCRDMNIAVLSRGYKRKTRGFQQVPADGTANDYGDEPLQIKKKFPQVTVAVDKSRTEGCRFLTSPELLATSRKARRCRHKDMPKAGLIILDDAFQHRAIKASLSIVLIDCSRPIFNDHLLPLGRLRDLPERADEADIIIVSKCPADMNGWQKSSWAEALGISGYDAESCSGTRYGGKQVHLFFTTVSYCTPEAVFPEGDHRYLYAKRLILFSGIANDKPLVRYLNDRYKIVGHFNFPDHHKFTQSDIRSIRSASDAFPTSVVMTTEKDCQRIRDMKDIPETLRQKMFYAPIKTEFLCGRDRQIFASAVKSRICRYQDSDLSESTLS